MLEIKSMIKNFKLKDLFWITPIILSVIGASLSLPAAPKVYLYQFYQFQSIIIFLSSVWFSWHLYEKKTLSTNDSNDWCSNIFYSRFAFKSAIDTYYGYTNFLYKQTYSLGIKII